MRAPYAVLRSSPGLYYAEVVSRHETVDAAVAAGTALYQEPYFDPFITVGELDRDWPVGKHVELAPLRRYWVPRKVAPVTLFAKEGWDQ
jgi:hypothetical protein